MKNKSYHMEYGRTVAKPAPFVFVRAGHFMRDAPESCCLCQRIIDPLYDPFSANLLVSKHKDGANAGRVRSVEVVRITVVVHISEGRTGNIVL